MSENFIRIDNTSEEVQKMLKKDGIVKQNEQTNEDQGKRIEKLEEQHLNKTYIPSSEKDNLATKEQLNKEVTELNKKIDSLPSGGGGEVVIQGVGKEGEGANAEIFNDYENNIALADFSTAKGYKTQAGAKCFRFDTSYQYTDKETELGFYVIPYQEDGITQEMRNAWTQAINSKQGLRYTIVLTSNYDLQGKVTSSWDLWDEVNKWGFYVTNFITPSTDPSSPAYLNEDSYIFFPDYPWIGIDTIGAGADASGYETQALAVGSRSGGLRSKSIGKYSDTSGRDTVAAYAAHAQNRETAALGEGSHSQGTKTTVTGFSGHIEGSSTNKATDYIYDENGKILSNEEIIEKYKEKPFSLSKGNNTHVEGKDNLGLETNQHIEGEGNIGLKKGVHIQGKYAEIDTEGKYLDIVGNGADDEHRSNVRTLDEDGNAWYAGDVHIKGHTPNDKAITLNANVEYNTYSYELDFSRKLISLKNNNVNIVGVVSTNICDCTLGGSGLNSIVNKDNTITPTNNQLNLVNNTGSVGRIKLFNFLTSNTKLTTADIGKVFYISFDYQFVSGNQAHFGLMANQDGNDYHTSLYKSTRLRSTEWTTFSTEIEIDEVMVTNQVGLLAFNVHPNSTLIVDNLKSIELKTLKTILDEKVDKKEYKNNQPTRTIKGGAFSIKQDDVIDNKSFAMKLLGETYRDGTPTFETPAPIYTAQMSLYIGNVEGELGHTLITPELCEGDYIDVDYKNKKVTHKRTKTKWAATEESLREIYLFEDEIYTEETESFMIGYAPNTIDETGITYDGIYLSYSNIVGKYYFCPWDTGFSAMVPEFYGMTAEEIKNYLVDNNCILYIDLDEPIYTDVTNTDCGQELLRWAEYFSQDFWLELASAGSIEMSYSANINSVLNDIKQENKEYVDNIIGDINSALDTILAMHEQLLGGESE